jgi:hypothetical protein
MRGCISILSENRKLVIYLETKTEWWDAKRLEKTLLGGTEEERKKRQLQGQSYCTGSRIN